MNSKQDMELYINDKHGSQLEEIKNKYKELSELPQNYNLKDKVYFQENQIKAKLGCIVCKQYRSARKRKRTMFFPTYEQAYEYYIKLRNELFDIASNTLDYFIPKQMAKYIDADIDYRISKLKKFTNISSLLIK